MSKRTVTMKSLLDENVLLKMRLHQLEAELSNAQPQQRKTEITHTLGGAAKHGESFFARVIRLAKGYTNE